MRNRQTISNTDTVALGKTFKNGSERLIHSPTRNSVLKSYCLSAFLGSDSYSTNRSFSRSLRKAFLVLAGAEDGVRKSSCRVVKINKAMTNPYFPVQRLTTVVWLSSRNGTYLELVEDRRAVIVRSKVERPLTLPSSIFSKLNYILCTRASSAFI